MSSGGYIFTAELVDQMRRNPMHEVLRDLAKAGRDTHLLESSEFRKLIGYLTEEADGRDRREPMTAVAGTHRPQPRLRVLINAAFGEYGDLTWFRLNKIANSSRLPLKGMFTRMAASVGRLSETDFAETMTAFVSENPDKSLLRLLNDRGGRIQNMGLELFTRLAYMFRPDLYFLIPKKWGEESGCFKFIDNDLRKYCALCRSLRTICDDIGFPQDVRGTLFDRAVQMDPVHSTVANALANSIGAALAWTNVLDPGDGYAPTRKGLDEISLPLEVASQAIRVRRGDARLRNQLIKMSRDACAISGNCPRDLLEVAYIAPYPAGDVHSARNAILLRSDLHTMWDLNLVAVHPDTREVHLSDRLRGTYYESFAGVVMNPGLDPGRLDTTGLKERWNHFLGARKKEQAASEAAGKGGKVSETNSAIPSLADIEPKKPGSSGIWRTPRQATAALAAPDLVSEPTGSDE